jgi:23S rRNA pseudouridine1911/1915/1917 synthase
MKYTAQSDITLFDALIHLSPESSKTNLRSWLKEGRVTVDGEPVKISASLVRKGQVVALGEKARFTSRGNVRILYEDRHIAVIDKPGGLLSVSTNFETGDTAHAILKDHYKPKRVFVVHRLDQDTSGVMMFALSEEARDKLKETFEKHDIERAYTAIVEGAVNPPKGTWESYLYEDAAYVVHSIEDKEVGKLAITHYEVQYVFKRYTTLVLKLETGRKNQIRVHCKDAGHPIVGDKKYGAKSNPIKRLCLHAHLLAFKHPITNKELRFESKLPEEFDKLKG